MKGFKPTGFGPSAGFKYPSSMGFTGSTGSVTNVSPHTRRIGFAKGGYVSKTVGDPGSSMVRRAKPSTEADRESGGKSPLRPGFASGGRMGRMMKAAVDKAHAQSAAPSSGSATGVGGGRTARMLSSAVQKAQAQPAAPSTGAATGLGGGRTARMIGQAMEQARTGTPRPYTGGGALGAALASAVRMAAEKRQQEQAAVKRIPTPSVKERFYEKGGKVIPRRPAEKRFTAGETLKAIPQVPGALIEHFTRGVKRRMYGGQRTVEGRNESVDERSTRVQRGYSHGGKAKRMGYADGGGVKKKPRVLSAPDDEGRARILKHSQSRLRWMKALHDSPEKFWDDDPATTDEAKRAYAQSQADYATSPNHRVNLKKTRTLKAAPLPAGFKGGGAVSREEVKKIAERTVGEHVRYPAPKGHKGLERVMRKADGGAVSAPDRAGDAYNMVRRAKTKGVGQAPKGHGPIGKRPPKN